MNPLVIVNPESAHGKTLKQWANIQNKLNQVLGEFDYVFTTHGSHAEQLARDYLNRKGLWVISVGGDGTLHEVVNGFFKNGKNQFPDAALSFVSTGTGSDFLKTIRKMVPESIEPDLLKKQTGKFVQYQIDAAKVESPDGTRYFINMMSAAMGGLVVYRINKYKFIKKTGGKAGYYLVTLFTLFTYKKKKTLIQLDGKTIYDDYLQNISIANGKFQGGGMMMAPEASLNDGLLDLIILKKPGLWETIRLSSKIYSGDHITHPEIECFKGSQINIDFASTFPQDVDGESYTHPPLKISVLPGAIKLKV